MPDILTAIPPEVQLPTPLLVVIAAGALSSAIMWIVRLVQRTGLGMSWLRQKVVEPEREDIRRIEGKLDAVLNELRSENGGSIREQVNNISAQLYDHIEASTTDRAYLHERLNGTIEANELDDPEV